MATGAAATRQIVTLPRHVYFPSHLSTFLRPASAVTFPPGSVALVGAGPGDPGLLTLAGAALLARADVVVYDALANPRLLGHAPGARHVFAGKRAAHHSMTQEQINALLVREARAGHRVVRLKGGDPFVFGRGGEEAEALASAKVPFVVVPGITAAVAAGAYAGIPVTHRDLNTSFSFVTGHEKEPTRQQPEAAARSAAPDAAAAEATDWAALAKLPALSFYMGVRSLGGIAEKLIAAGMSPDTPAASVQWGTTRKQKTVVATLATLPQEIERQGLGSPAITYVGRIVAMRDALRWFDDPQRYPLLGKTILVTRTREQASELSQRLEALGANVLEAPTIRIEPPSDPTPLDNVLRRLAHSTPNSEPASAGGPDPTYPRFDWLLFTSPNGVLKTRQRLDALHLDARVFARLRIAAVGPATARACQDHLALRPDLVPERFDADALADAFDDVADQGFLLLRADIGRASLVDSLRARGAEVLDIAVYETRLVDRLPDHVLDALDAGEIDAACFTSGSTARNLVSLLGSPARLGAAKLLSIGPRTSEAMRACGLKVEAEAAQATLDALVEAARDALLGR